MSLQVASQFRKKLKTLDFVAFYAVMKKKMHKQAIRCTKSLPKMKIFSTLGLQTFAKHLMLVKKQIDPRQLLKNRLRDHVRQNPRLD
jgi:hypothetical protein